MKRLMVCAAMAVCFLSTLAFGAPCTWLGKSSAWSDPQNWSGGAVPGTNDDIVIVAGVPQQPVLTNTVTIIEGSLKIAKGARLVSYGHVRVKSGKLVIEDGAELDLGAVRKGAEVLSEYGNEMFMGPARKDNEIIDVALTVRGPLSPEVYPDIAVVSNPPPMSNCVTVITNTVGPALPEAVKLVNIAPFADLKAVPYTSMVRWYVDADEQLRTAAGHELGTPMRANRIELSYKEPQTITAIRWAVAGGPWAILADTTGKGAYDKLVRMDLAGKLETPGGIWRSRAWIHNNFQPPLKAYGIRLINPSGDLALFDVQIMVPAGESKFPKAQDLEKDVPQVAAGEAVDVPEPPLEKQIPKGFDIEPWMFSAQQWLELTTNRPPLVEYKPFLDLVEGIRKVHGNFVNLWPPKTFGAARGKRTYEMDLLWPSQYDLYPIKENALKAISDAFRKKGIIFYTMERCPYPKKLAEYPVTSTSQQPAPYIDREFREYIAGYVREQTQTGADGVGIGWDEMKFGNWSRGPGYPMMIVEPKKANELTKKYFQEHYKSAVPAGPSDTLEWRKWLIYSYDSFASYLKDATDAAKKTNRKVRTFTAITALDTAFNCRMNYGAAFDIIGHTADIDVFRASGYGSHFETTANVKRCMAVTKGRGIISLHNCPWASDPVNQPGYYLEFTPVQMAGPPVSVVMHGGQMIGYWRYNFIYYGGYDKYVAQSFGLLDTLAAWGIKDARVPRSIAVLRSRASEDWWQVRNRYGRDGNPLDQSRGFYYEKWLLEFLLTNGYPFDMFCQEYPEDFARDLSKYDLVILPFPYSMSTEAFEAVAKAAKAGVKILACDRRGETDEWGTPYAKPLLADLIAEGKVSFMEDDVPAVGHYRDVQAKMRRTVDGLLGERNPFYLNTYGKDVEGSILEKNEKEKFVSLINWTEQSATVDVGVRMPERGEYRILQCDLLGAKKVLLSGKEVVGAAPLRKFRVSMGPGEIRVFYIRPAR